jgi:hypothetical protein
MKKTEIYRKSVINMGTNVYNKLPRVLKEIDDNRVFLEEIKVIPSPPIVLFGGRIWIHIGGHHDL